MIRPMKPNRTPLEGEELTKVKTWFADKVCRCSCCGKVDSLNNAECGYIQFQTNSTIGQRADIPVVMLTCDCGFISFFNAETIGIVNNMG